MHVYNLKRLGFWSQKYENGVTPKFLCGDISNEIKAKIISYLKSCPKNGVELGYARCRFECSYSMTSEMGSCVHTDGIWTWPEGLAHYVERHSLLLPEEFITHLKKLRFYPPTVDSELVANICLNSNKNIEIIESDKAWSNWLTEKGEEEYLKSPEIVTPCKPQDRVTEKGLVDDWWAKT